MALFPLFILFLLILITRYHFIRRKYSPGGEFEQIRDTEQVQTIPEEERKEFPGKLARLIRIPTVSWTDRTKRDLSSFREFQKELETLFPVVHKNMAVEKLSDFALLYHWKGSDPSLKPVLFLAHYDVVPAEENGEEVWLKPPFSGEIEEEELWGRGTLDIKVQLALLMETAEALLEQNFQPERDIWFAFGGDEEIAGLEGAGVLSKELTSRNLKFEFIMDEGGIIARDQLAFLKGKPAALIGMAEKGFVTFKISSPGTSGHSSMPVKKGTAIGRLSRGIVRLERKLFPSRLVPVMRNMLERFVPWVNPALGFLFANLWISAPLIRFVFSRNPTTDSLIRTTQAVTVFNSGEQENILPGEAACMVNHRILPGDSISRMHKRHKRTLRDRSLKVEDAGNWPSNDPIEATNPSGTGFTLLREVLEESHPEAVAVPFLVNGSTDSKYYRDLSDQILRFTPLELTPQDLKTIHGINERVSLKNLDRGLDFYCRLFSRL